jgi:hypothetical protein
MAGSTAVRERSASEPWQLPQLTVLVAGESRVSRESVRGSRGRTDSLLGEDVSSPRSETRYATPCARGARSGCARPCDERLDGVSDALCIPPSRLRRHARADAYQVSLGLAPLSMHRGGVEQPERRSTGSIGVRDRSERSFRSCGNCHSQPFQSVVERSEPWPTGSTAVRERSASELWQLPPA